MDYFFRTRPTAHGEIFGPAPHGNYQREKHRSAIDKCPAEVLTEIFLHYLTERSRGSRIQQLLCVCKLWNQLLTNNPSLWTKITLSMQAMKPYGRGPHLHLVRKSIERSRNMPLDIEVNTAHVNPVTKGVEECGDTCEAIVNLLVNNQHRWRTLRVMLPGASGAWNTNKAIGKLLRGRAPNLVELSVRNFQWRDQQRVTFSDLPRLRVLRINGYAFVGLVRPLSIGSICRLDLDLSGFEVWAGRGRYTRWTKYVSRLESLRCLHLRYTRSLGPPPTRFSLQGPIELPVLEELGLWKVDILGLQFKLPALRTLEFDDLTFPKVNPTEVIWRCSWGDPAVTVTAGHLKHMIRRYPSATLFVLPCWTEHILAAALRSIKAEESHLTSTISFVKETREGGRQPMDVNVE